MLPSAYKVNRNELTARRGLRIYDGSGDADRIHAS